MPTTYTVPDNPADVEAAALDLIAHMPGEVFDAPAAMTAVLQEFCGMLQLEGCFTGMSWHDAKHAAVAILVDAINRDDASEFLKVRARNALSGRDGMTWDDPAAMARALTIGATVLGL